MAQAAVARKTVTLYKLNWGNHVDGHVQPIEEYSLKPVTTIMGFEKWKIFTKFSI